MESRLSITSPPEKFQNPLEHAVSRPEIVCGGENSFYNPTVVSCERLNGFIKLPVKSHNLKGYF